MRSLFSRLTAILLFSIFVLEKPALTSNDQTLLISHVNIIDISNNTRIENQFVYIVGDKIKQISSIRPETLADTKVIDGEDKYLMPGLVDMHVHVMQEADIYQLLRYGVTTARVMYGWPQTLEYRDKIRKGLLLGPDLIVASPIINQESPYASSFIHKFVNTPSQARDLVKEYKEQGYDLIKTYDGLQPEVFDEISLTAKANNLPLAGHPSFYLSLDDYIAAKPQTIEHIEMLYQASLDYSRDEKLLEQLAKKLSEQKIPVTTTLVVYDNLARMAVEKQPYIDSLPVEYVHPLIKDHEQGSVDFITSLDNPQEWRSKADYLGYMAKVFEENNVPLVIGSDGGVGYTINGVSTIDEMELLASYGLPINSILRAATIAPALALNKEKEIGVIEIGYKANLILLHSDPRKDLSVLRHPVAVIKSGTFIGRQKLIELDTKSKQHMGWFNTYWNLFWGLY